MRAKSRQAEPARERAEVERQEAATASSSFVAAQRARRRCLGPDEEDGDCGETEEEEGDDDEESTAVMVSALLDFLVQRHQSAEEMEALAGCHRLLCLVLRNAATKEAPKYRRLDAAKSRLYLSLLQHPELVAVLRLAGFVIQKKRPEATAAAVDTAAMRRGEERDLLLVALARQLDQTVQDRASVALLVQQLEQLSSGSTSKVARKEEEEEVSSSLVAVSLADKLFQEEGGGENSPQGACLVIKQDSDILTHPGAAAVALMNRLVGVLQAVTVWRPPEKR